jgi:nucleoid DNA-binding protein
MANNDAAKAKPLTKSAVYQELATSTKLTRKQVSEVFDALTKLIKRELGKKGPGVFAIPGLLKLTLKRKPATKAMTKPDPFHPGQMMQVKAKPATNVVKARPLKALNQMVK